MHWKAHVQRGLLVTAAAVSFTACSGTGFDPASKIKGLRVLAVQKEVRDVVDEHQLPDAYGVPEHRVNLKLLYVDGKSTPDAPRAVETMWIGQPPFACFNPDGDLRASCFVPGHAGTNVPEGSIGASPNSDGSAGDAGTGDAGAGDAGTNGEGAIDAGSDIDGGDIDAASGGTTGDAGTPSSDTDGGAGSGDATSVASRFTTYAIDIPKNDPRKPNEDFLREPQQKNPSYGLAYSFFIVCAGHIQIDTTGGFPLTCIDSKTGEVLGEDDFVSGYTAIYVYNPVDHALFKDGKPVLDEKGQPVIEPGISNHNPVVSGFDFDGMTATAPIHVPRCKDDCPEHPIKAVIDSTLTPEQDVAAGAKEEVWVDYYATKGSFTHDLRLVNDAVAGWNDDHGSAWRVPTEPGPATIWAVVHDSRGGVAWTSISVVVD